MTDKECLDKIAKLTNDLKLAYVTTEDYTKTIKYASINDIADELWHFYCFANDIKNLIIQVEKTKEGEERRSND